MYKWGHGCVSLCLAYFTSITSSRFIHVVTNDKLSFLWLNNMPLYVHVCVYSLHFLYPFSHLSMTPGLFPYLAYVKNVAVNVGLHTSLQDSGFISFRYILHIVFTFIQPGFFLLINSGNPFTPNMRTDIVRIVCSFFGVWFFVCYTSWFFSPFLHFVIPTEFS